MSQPLVLVTIIHVLSCLQCNMRLELVHVGNCKPQSLVSVSITGEHFVHCTAKDDAIVASWKSGKDFQPSCLILQTLLAVASTKGEIILV